MSDGRSLSKLCDSCKQQTHGEENETKAESDTSLIPSQLQQSPILRLPELHVILFLIAPSEIFLHGCFIEAM